MSGRERGREGGGRGSGPTYAELDALGVLAELRGLGADLAPWRGGLRLVGFARPPLSLLRRALELAVEIRRELRHPARGAGCATCGGAAFYVEDGSWWCLLCEGLPAGELPRWWSLSGPVDG